MNQTSLGTLVIGPGALDTGTALSAAASRAGLAVRLLDPGPKPAGDTWSAGPHFFYGGPILGASLVRDLGWGLLEPEDDWLTRCPHEFVGRDIRLTVLGELPNLAGVRFVKPPREKAFPAQLIDLDDLRALDRLLAEFPITADVLVSDPVFFETEYRVYYLDGRPVTLARYARYGQLSPARIDDCPQGLGAVGFAEAISGWVASSLPSAVVVDIGLLTRPDGGPSYWAVVEANMAWFSNLYLCEPDLVLPVVLRSAGPVNEISGRDSRYIRRPAH
jgi:hypothetical protein